MTSSGRYGRRPAQPEPPSGARRFGAKAASLAALPALVLMLALGRETEPDAVEATIERHKGPDRPVEALAPPPPPKEPAGAFDQASRTWKSADVDFCVSGAQLAVGLRRSKGENPPEKPIEELREECAAKAREEARGQAH